MQKQEKKSGIIAGIALIVMALAAGFSFGHVHNSLFVESSEISFQNLLTQKSLFFAGLAGWLIIFATDLVVAFALLRFFLETARQASILTAFIRIMYTLVLGFAIFQLFMIIPLLSSGEADGLISAPEQAAARIFQFEKIWSFGLIIFGFHLAGLGYLSLKSRAVPDILGYLLILGGASYTLIHAFRQLSIVDEAIVEKAEKILSLPMALAEILLAFWLIYRGFKKEKSAL